MKKPQLPSDRRTFLKTGGLLAGGLFATSAPLSAAPTTLPALPENSRTQAAMPTRNLGKTGYKVGIFSLGGQAAIEKPQSFE